MKFYLVYTEGCTPKLKAFDSKKAREAFMLQFLLESQNNADNFIDLAFEGTVSYNDYQTGEDSNETI